MYIRCKGILQMYMYTCKLCNDIPAGYKGQSLLFPPD